jgi:hypothetical protein
MALLKRHMTKNTVIDFAIPSDFSPDPLTDVLVQVPRVRDGGANADGSKVRFSSSLVPPYLRRPNL